MPDDNLDAGGGAEHAGRFQTSSGIGHTTILSAPAR